MSDFSLTLVMRLTTSKIINDMAKVQIKSEKITPFGGIFHVRELFSRFVAPIIDKVLGIRCTSFGYQYSEIVGSLALISDSYFSDLLAFAVTTGASIVSCRSASPGFEPNREYKNSIIIFHR